MTDMNLPDKSTSSEKHKPSVLEGVESLIIDFSLSLDESVNKIIALTEGDFDSAVSILDSMMLSLKNGLTREMSYKEDLSIRNSIIRISTIRYIILIRQKIDILKEEGCPEDIFNLDLVKPQEGLLFVCPINILTEFKKNLTDNSSESNLLAEIVQIREKNVKLEESFKGGSDFYKEKANIYYEIRKNDIELFDAITKFVASHPNLVNQINKLFTKELSRLDLSGYHVKVICNRLRKNADEGLARYNQDHIDGPFVEVLSKLNEMGIVTLDHCSGSMEKDREQSGLGIGMDGSISYLVLYKHESGFPYISLRFQEEKIDFYIILQQIAHKYNCEVEFDEVGGENRVSIYGKKLNNGKKMLSLFKEAFSKMLLDPDTDNQNSELTNEQKFKINDIVIKCFKRIDRFKLNSRLSILRGKINSATQYNKTLLGKSRGDKIEEIIDGAIKETLKLLDKNTSNHTHLKKVREILNNYSNQKIEKIELF